MKKVTTESMPAINLSCFLFVNLKPFPIFVSDPNLLHNESTDHS